jgi:hypothetical protein
MLQLSSVLALALLGCSSAVSQADGSDTDALHGECDQLECHARDWSQAGLARAADPPTAAEAGCEHELSADDRDREASPPAAVAMVANDSSETATVKLTRGGTLVDVTVLAAGSAGAIGLPGLPASSEGADPQTTDDPAYRVSSDQPVRVYRSSHAAVEEEPMQQQAFVKLGVTLVPLMLVHPSSTGCAAPLEPAPVDDSSRDEGTGGEPDPGNGGATTAAAAGGASNTTTSSSGGTAASTTGAGGTATPEPTCDSPDPNQCVTCQQCAATTQCKPEYDACTTAPDCTNLSDCLTTCNAEPTCEDNCLTQHPSGAPLLEAAANCLYCTACPASCNLCN